MADWVFLNYGTAKLGKTICSPTYTILCEQIGVYVRVLSQYTTMSVCGHQCRNWLLTDICKEWTHGRISKHCGLNLSSSNKYHANEHFCVVQLIKLSIQRDLCLPLLLVINIYSKILGSIICVSL